MKKTLVDLIVNLGLLVSGLLTIFSGLLLQVEYHIGNQGKVDVNGRVLGISYYGWSSIHKLSIIILLVLMVFHIYRHWKWFGMVIRKSLVAKNKQVLTLSVIFVMVAVVGLIPWVIYLLDGDSVIRKAFIELHDKLAIILSIYLLLHILKRLKWYLLAIRKLKYNQGVTKIQINKE